MIRVVVAEDSRAARELLVEILRGDPGITVVGEAADGARAVEMVERMRPDLVTMDIHMPGMDGFQATREIMARVPTPILIVSSAADRSDVALSLQATRHGALMVLPKPSSPGSPTFDAEARELVAMVKALADVKLVRRRTVAPSAPATASPAPGPRPGPRPRVVAVAASTGGPAAIQTVLSALPGDFPLPVLVVQHISPGFVGPLAEWLGGSTPLRVRVAGVGERLAAGTVYLAPDGHHLGVGAGGLVLLGDGAPVAGFRPSGSFLFQSVARAYGAAAVAVILTGMGSDGVAGLEAARKAGARVLAQDEATCVVYGMPREAVRAGVVDEVLPLEAIAGRLRALATAG